MCSDEFRWATIVIIMKPKWGCFIRDFKQTIAYRTWVIPDLDPNAQPYKGFDQRSKISISSHEYYPGHIFSKCMVKSVDCQENINLFLTKLTGVAGKAAKANVKPLVRLNLVKHFLLCFNTIFELFLRFVYLRDVVQTVV